MIWFYERRGEHLRCEIQQQIEGDRFALIVTLPDGTERVELFEDSGTLNRRSIELEKLLRERLGVRRLLRREEDDVRVARHAGDE